MTTLRLMPVPVRSRRWESRSWTAISGYCLGGGFRLASACDFRFGDRTATIGIASAKLSIISSARRLQRLLALTDVNAKRILYVAERDRAEQAMSVGLRDKSDDDIRDRRRKNSSSAFRAIRRFRSRASNTTQ
jgi:enoyl-CoA hydratase/carnithine racemase